MEAVWHHTFYDCLFTQPEEHPVLLTESPLCPRSNREKMTQIMFETFNTPAIYISSSLLLSLYGAGRLTGIVLEIGHTTSYTVPILKGYAIPHAALRQEISGIQLTDFLIKSLIDRRLYKSYSKSDRDMVRLIKETLFSVSLDYKHDIFNTINNENVYRLPDGSRVRLGADLIRIPETLFKPFLCSVCSPGWKPDLGVHESIYTAVNGCGNDIRNYLYNNIVLSGGSSLISGLRERLEKEISLLSSHAYKIRVIAPTERKYLAWIGGSILTSLSTFNSMWISKEEYDETGHSICGPRITF